MEPACNRSGPDLLSDGTTTHFTGSELSRLRRLLRSSTVRHVAYLAGGLGGAWGRYRPLETPDGIAPIGPTTTDDIMHVGGSQRMTCGAVPDLDEFERQVLVAPDGDGNLGVVERRLDTRAARILLDTYLLGDSRESAAAAQALKERADGL